MGKNKLVKILLVEDNDIDSAITLRELSKPIVMPLNFEIERVKSLKSTFEKVNKVLFDVILLDFNLPDSMGIITLKKVLKEVKRIPVIILTGTDDQHLAMSGIKMGAEDFIFKGDLNNEKLVISIWNAIERTQQKNLRSDFISTVSHELKTPLTGIRNVISNALEGVYGDVVENLRESLQIAESDIIRLTTIINDLLEISKFDSSSVKMNLNIHEIHPLIEGALHSFEKVHKEKNMAIKIDVGKSIRLLCDKDKIIQILINLVANATKFTPDKGLITISALELETKVVCFCVSDTGIGVPDSEKDRIFERFVQLDNSFGPGAKGTGLGLAIVKELVELHHGRVWVEDHPVRGSEFYFTIPIQRKEEVTHE